MNEDDKTTDLEIKPFDKLKNFSNQLNSIY